MTKDQPEFGYDAFVDRFFQLEEELALFELRVRNVPIWEWLRFPVYRELQLQTGLIDQPHSSSGSDVGEYLRGMWLWGRNFVVRNPFLADGGERMYLGHSRRKRNEDGTWWDIYCDPIHEQEDADYVHFEIPYRNGHLSPAKTNALRYLDVIHYSGTIGRALPLVNVSITGDTRERVREIEDEFSTVFGAKLDLESKTVDVLTERAITLPLYERLLRRINPDVVIVVVSYYRETFVEACKRTGVPVVELQHGGFGRDHPGYSFPGKRTKRTFPDYLFVFGDYWKEIVDFAISKEDVYVVGYPYLEMERNRHASTKDGRPVVFVSQGPIGRELTRFAASYATLDETNDVIVKLHPGEYNRWRDSYPWLVDSPVKVVASDDPPLYELLAGSSAQVGVNSTVLYEGLNFSLDTYLVDLPGFTRMNELIDRGYATVVSTPAQLYDHLHSGKQPREIDTDYFFKSGAVDNINEALEDIYERERRKST